MSLPGLPRSAAVRRNARRRLSVLVATVALLTAGLAPLATPAGARPSDFTITAAAGSTTAYVANFNDDTVSVINSATNAVTATIPVGDGPRFAAATPTPGGSTSPTSWPTRYR